MRLLTRLYGMYIHLQYVRIFFVRVPVGWLCTLSGDVLFSLFG